MLGDYYIDVDYGLYTDMNALRPDENPENLHSYYVDQWHRDSAIREVDRNLGFLKRIVKKSMKLCWPQSLWFMRVILRLHQYCLRR